MTSGSSIFKIHFFLIVLVVQILVVISGVAWVYLETRSCAADAVSIRASEIIRFRKEAERHLNAFVFRMDRSPVSRLPGTVFEEEASRSVWRESFGERGFLFLFFPESGRFAGRWHGKEHLIQLTELKDMSGHPFLQEPCSRVLKTGKSIWLDNVLTGWSPDHEKWSFYLSPYGSRNLVVGAALDMAETTRTADANMKLSREHIRHFAVGVVAFLIMMLLATLAVAFLLAQKMSREIEAYARSLEKALADGKPLELRDNQLREFKKLAIHTNRLLERQKRTEKQYRKLFETNAVSIWVEDFSEVRSMLENLKANDVSDPDTYFREHPEFVKKAAGAIRVLDVNRETLRLYGADTKDQLLSSLEAVFSPASYRGFAFLLAALFRGEHLIRYEEVNRTLSGLDIYVLITVTVEESEDLNRLIVSLVDITERKQAEEALAEEKDRLAATLHSIGDGVLVTDAKGRIMMMNPAAGEMTGYTPSDVLGYPLEQVYRVVRVGNGHGIDDTTRLFFKMENLEIEGEELVLTSAGGYRYIIDESRSPIIGSSRKFRGMVVVFRDITGLKRTQACFARAKRLESLGLLAAGIAHDFNNVMTSVFGNISLARMLSEPESKVAEKLGAAEAAIERARELTSQLITFSRGGAPVEKEVDLSALIHSSVKRAVGTASTEWVIAFAESLWQVKVDAAQFVHVVNNLVQNAVEAMDGGGRLKITIENARIDGSDPTVAEGDYVRLLFEDSGCGIFPEHLDRIFDPYFTTKEGAQGLGLSIVYGIVKRHDGYIRVESEPGRGSTFEVLLPAGEGK
ncbi:MAG: PAS domain S-box protein [Acidobacteria bacterium]|nr:PAS domain S-box protein [Acidobacteriota bacterium]